MSCECNWDNRYKKETTFNWIVECPYEPVPCSQYELDSRIICRSLVMFIMTKGQMFDNLSIWYVCRWSCSVTSIRDVLKSKAVIFKANKEKISTWSESSEWPGSWLGTWWKAASPIYRWEYRCQIQMAHQPAEVDRTSRTGGSGGVTAGPQRRHDSRTQNSLDEQYQTSSLSLLT